MRYIVCVALALVMLLTATCLAESILPALSDSKPEAVAPEEVMMPSLEQVSWYDHDSFRKNEDGRLVYHYSRVSESAYQSLGAAMGEAGYVLKDSATEENGDLCFLAGDDAVEMEIVYHGVGGDMDIYYPENAMLETRDEEALTVHLALGEPFLITDECSYALECVKPVFPRSPDMRGRRRALKRNSMWCSATAATIRQPMTLRQAGSSESDITIKRALATAVSSAPGATLTFP